MSVRIFFNLLIVTVMAGVGIFFSVHHYQEKYKVPQAPCYSTIKQGAFVDDDQQAYIFNGNITWWPYQEKLSIFGISKNSQGSVVINRSLELSNLWQYKNSVHARVAKVEVAASDRLGDGKALISPVGAPISIIFKPISERKWLMMINDNWVAMCEKK
ncbi:hypothetical protein BTJ39_05060 [Izhakiella australiensis]|uniref:Uncharacterized protein n=1 Tax=Izhakiella australiensis TaxID=1926881 RepID=A0A1S8YQJ1_9GAMM|nr:hypothetical protein [Izhakiella australiensis]OON41334.1 hypothetical protein BTJ39_05060 [Izhakiella australiensis]